MRLTKVAKQAEIKKIWRLEVALFQSCESRTKKQFSEDSRLRQPIRIFWVIKRKRKEAAYIFIYQRCRLSWLYKSFESNIISKWVRVNLFAHSWISSRIGIYRLYTVNLFQVLVYVLYTQLNGFWRSLIISSNAI